MTAQLPKHEILRRQWLTAQRLWTQAKPVKSQEDITWLAWVAERMTRVESYTPGAVKAKTIKRPINLNIDALL